jgi:dipeptidyl aminopeptidase/acylaminoacyl peptidase
MTTAPYGSWKSSITSELIVAETIGLDELRRDGQDWYWIESRPTEAGRRVIVRRQSDGTTTDSLPAPFNARTRVHEYGGGAYAVADGTIYFANDADQRVYRLDPGARPRPLTPDLPGMALRYADFEHDPARHRLICIREDHRQSDQEAVNTIVAIDTEGRSGEDGGKVLASGNDFYASARLSPEGSRLAWRTWNHPHMPWNGTELWMGEVLGDGSIGDATLVAGGEEESIFQPEWSPDGVLHFISDRSGWWNLYRSHGGAAEPLCPMEAEFGLPQWVFGQSTYAFVSAEQIVCAYTQRGLWQLATLDLAARRLTPLNTGYTDIDNIRAGSGMAGFIGGAPATALSAVQVDLRTGELEVLRRSSNLDLDPRYLSSPQPVEFPTEDGQTAYGFYYAPTNPDFTGPERELPPLVVLSHGGPTSATSTSLSLRTQYWTSRGFAVLDVNYGGSTGYGRAYWERLTGRWGIVDVDDCVDGARFLAARGLVDPNRLIIRGWSASGYTTLAALTFREVFKAGASHYGISDLEAMATDTHKFESRYLDQLIGPYPERKDLYVERSPIHYVHRMTAPLILFQGLEDKVVPPNQAEMMAEAVTSKGLPVALVEFEGEQHGVRQAENIRRALDGELFFLGKIFGFEPAESIEPVPIANL